MIGKVFAAPTIPAGFSVRVKATPASPYADYVKDVAKLAEGEELVLLPAKGETVAKSFRTTLGRRLRDAFGVRGCEIMRIENLSTGENGFIVKKLALESEAEAAA